MKYIILLLLLSGCSDSNFVTTFGWMTRIAAVFVAIGGFGQWYYETKAKKTEQEKAENSKDAFFLADTNYDIKLSISDDHIKNLPHKEYGSLTVLLHFFEEGNEQNYARLHLSGKWEGNTGVISELKDDLVFFVEPDKSFIAIQKKPFIEHIDPKLRILYPNKNYLIQLTAMPMTLAIPLKPLSLSIKTKDGMSYHLDGFEDVGKGWYSTKFAFLNSKK